MDALAVLQRLGNGTLIEDVVDALSKTAHEAVLSGKPGTVTVTLKVSCKVAGDPFVMIEESVARTAPKKDPKGAYLFSVDGVLHRDDPRQARIDFREIDRETGEIKTVDHGATTREVS